MAGRDVAAVCERTVDSFDGTKIACRETGAGPHMMLANGLGGTWTAWRHLIEFFRDRYHVISWDYRGTYRSGLSAVPGRYDMATHVSDALAVADAFGVEQAIWVGWSMGVQLNLEVCARAAGRVRALVIINGAYGRPFDTALGWRYSRYLIPAAGRLVRDMPGPFSAVLRLGVGHEWLLSALISLGFAGPTLDRDVFRDLARDFSRLDLQAYFSTLLELGRHDAEHALGGIRRPTLIVAGDRDPMTPRGVSEEMARRIAGAEILIVRGGTHYVPVEFPELMNLRIEKFFREHDLLPASGAAGDGTAGGALRPVG
ncbi:MAG: alpha/beta hydrolase [Deltaproteobacteria bacterium]|nr:alpha/beta hydrolase [Deltaproteobacteria bacterium]